jgi:hypothetical protein
MDIAKFIEKCIRWGEIRISDKYKGMSWKLRYEIAALTENINYGCDFNEEGICVGMRDKDKFMPHYQAGKEKCSCCYDCARSVGYLHNIPSNNLIKDYAESFDEEKGFWREGKGCILPRTHRSITCLRHRCHPNDELLNPMDNLILDMLSRLGRATDTYNTFINFIEKNYENNGKKG